LAFVLRLHHIACKSLREKKARYLITGKIDGAQNTYVYFKPGYGPNYGSTDSVFSIDGKFVFSGEVREPELKSLYVQGQKLGIAFVLEPGEIKITGISTDMNNANVTGGTENNTYNKYRELGKERGREYQ
jgi:hypothetical protein